MAFFVPFVVGAAGAWIWRNLPAISKLSEALPTYEEIIEVRAYGNARSQKKDLFRLALSVAFGQVTQLNGFNTPFSIRVDYDLMAKSVSVILSYVYSGAINKSVNTLNGVPGGKYLDPILNGCPTENVVTGDYNRAGWFLSGPFLANKPALPHGKTVGHGTIDGAMGAIQPGPVGDGISRGTFVEKLFYAKLSDACADNPSQPYETVNKKQKNSILIFPKPNAKTAPVAPATTTNNVTAGSSAAPVGSTTSLLQTLFSSLGLISSPASPPPISSATPNPSTSAINQAG
jgi:hypothetical protein